MVIDKGDCVERAARGMFVGVLALACGACGGDQHNEGPSAGNPNAGGSAGLAGAVSFGGTTSSGGSAVSGGDAAVAGDASDGGASNEAGSSGEGGTDVGGMAGEGATDAGGTSAAGTSSSGASSGGTNSAGTSSGGASAASGTDSGGMSSGGTGGTDSGGASFGGSNSAGTEAGGTTSGGANSAGTSSGGTNSAGTSSGGTDSGGTSAAGTSSGGTNSAGTNSGGAPASCGDAMLGAAEECDDGNSQNLDGCNASCKYEVVDRMTSISLQGASAPDFCSTPTNTLGRAFSSLALSQINAQIQQSINDGALNNLLQVSGLEDLTGASNDSALAVGFLPAFPDVAKGPWPGGNPLDFWFRVSPASVDAQGLPLNALLGTLTGRSLSAGPGLLKLPLAIGGTPSTLSVANARLRSTLNATPAPNVPAPPPANLAPGLTVFQTITGSGSSQGICGNVTVESLAHIPVPASLASGSSSACLACAGSRTYTACSGSTVEPGCNSMLDVLVGGCKAVACFVTVVTPAQPDVPAPGSASVSPLSLGAGNAIPSSQSTGNNDAYSSYFKFDANRAHITGLH
jgi:cysteine-rich repeat protein